MAERTEDNRTEDEEEGSGAVKTFLEHLEDLRWMLIKSAAATLVAMTVCLFNVKPLVAVLKWPIDRAAKRHIFLMPEATNQVVTFVIGNMRYPDVDLETNRVGALDLGTNQHTTVVLDFTNSGGHAGGNLAGDSHFGGGSRFQRSEPGFPGTPPSRSCSGCAFRSLPGCSWPRLSCFTTSGNSSCPP